MDIVSVGAWGVWVEETPGGELTEHRVQATECRVTLSGALVFNDAEGGLSKAWAPGHWVHVRRLA